MKGTAKVIETDFKYIGREVPMGDAVIRLHTYTKKPPKIPIGDITMLEIHANSKLTHPPTLIMTRSGFSQLDWHERSSEVFKLLLKSFRKRD